MVRSNGLVEVEFRVRALWPEHFSSPAAARLPEPVLARVVRRGIHPRLRPPSCFAEIPKQQLVAEQRSGGLVFTFALRVTYRVGKSDET